MRRWLGSFLLRSSARFSIAHPWQFGLSILGIALGVAVVISITQAAESAKRAFELSSRAITGSATHQLIASSIGFVYLTILLNTQRSKSSQWFFWGSGLFAIGLGDKIEKVLAGDDFVAGMTEFHRAGAVILAVAQDAAVRQDHPIAPIGGLPAHPGG